MGDRRKHDFSKGPVWDPATSRWLVIRFTDGSRRRRWFRRGRRAQRAWAIQHTRHRTRPAVWEKTLGADTPLAPITPPRFEAVKLQRVQKVSGTTVDTDLATLEASFNW